MDGARRQGMAEQRQARAATAAGATGAGRRRGRTVPPWLAVLLLAVGLAAPSRPAPAGFVADLSDHLIRITTAFSGTDVLLFGAADEPGTEVAVTVRGPIRDTTVWRKARVGPIWINTESVIFPTVPSFYAVATSEPLEALADNATLVRHEIGIDHLRLKPLGTDGLSPEEVAAFRVALVRNMQRAGLFVSGTGHVSFLGDTLFRTRLFFPANVVPGLYQVQVLQIVKGQVVGAQASALEISKVGLEADLYEFSLYRPAAYGLLSIVIALAAGWIAHVMFRKA